MEFAVVTPRSRCSHRVNTKSLGAEFRSLKSRNFILLTHIQTPPRYRKGRIILSVVLQKKAQGSRRLLGSVGDRSDGFPQPEESGP
jgi:hypothetical protein